MYWSDSDPLHKTGVNGLVTINNLYCRIIQRITLAVTIAVTVTYNYEVSYSIVTYLTYLDYKQHFKAKHLLLASFVEKV